jgi:hypothetical protein
VGRKLFAVAAIGLSLFLTGCAATPSSAPTDTPGSAQTFDPALIPTAPEEGALAVEPKVFDNGLGEYTFKVGGGPVWCTLNSDEEFAICEQNEADATYDAIEVPSGCKQSYGYQFRLTSGKAGQINCTSGLYADPSLAQTLNPDETVTVGDITCFVSEVTARCDSKNGHYIVLGPEVWARG